MFFLLESAVKGCEQDGDLQLGMCINNYPKHRVEKCGDAASSPSQWPCWARKHQQCLQPASVKGGSYPTPHVNLPIAQYLGFL